MTGTDHPPSTTRPAHLAPTEHLPRRALLTCVAAFSAIAISIAVVVATVGGTALAAASEPFAATTTSIIRDQRDMRAQDRGEVALANIEALAMAVAPTTPPAPPAPPTTEAPPPPAPTPAVQPVTSGGGYNDPDNPAAWDRLSQCESGGNWAANTGNGYYGGIQFSLASWQAVGGTGRPDEASRETQIAMGQRLWNQGGWVHWPACSSQLGYR
jgi:hypothetical protein